MQNLRAAFLTAVGIGLIALALAGVAERGVQARLERALHPGAVVQRDSWGFVACDLGNPCTRLWAQLYN